MLVQLLFQYPVELLLLWDFSSWRDETKSPFCRGTSIGGGFRSSNRLKNWICEEI